MQQQVPSIGRYVLRRELGTGGFATVYRAHDPVLDREVALKLLHPHLARDPETRGRFVREGRALARVRHPNIVQVYDAGEASGGLLGAETLAYLAMELVEGRPLADLLLEWGRATVTQTVAITDHVAAALTAVHERRLVHRDVKPANILIEAETGRAVLLDLGIAHAADASVVSGHGWLIGTPGYMAPEQVEGGAVTPQTDLYQLAATVFAMLAGRPPFEGEPTTAIYAIVHRAPPDLATLRPELPPAVAAVVMEALAKDPARRPAGVSAFAAELRRAAGGATTLVAARPPTTTPSQAGDPAAPAAAPSPSSSAPAALAAAPPPSFSDPADALTARRPPQRGGPPDDRLPAGAAAGGGLRGGRRSGRWPAAAIGAVVLVLAAMVAGGVVAVRARGGDEAPERRGRLRAVAATARSERPADPTPPAIVPAATATAPLPATPRPQTATASPTAARTATAATPTTARPGAEVSGALAAKMQERGYTPEGEIVAVRASVVGGTLYVQKGVCADTANGRCQLVFVFLDDRFLGTDTLNPSRGITSIQAAGTARFAVVYQAFAASDPACCPSLPPVTITYTWDGARLNPSGTPPGHRR